MVVFELVPEGVDESFSEEGILLQGLHESISRIAKDCPDNLRGDIAKYSMFTAPVRRAEEDDAIDSAHAEMVFEPAPARQSRVASTSSK